MSARTLIVAGLLAACLAGSACGGSSSGAAPPVDLALPTTREPSAPVGDAPALELGPLIETAPVSALADPPGPGPVLVTTLEGQVLAVDLDRGTTDVVLDLRDRITWGGEQGLLGIAIDPAGDRMYLDYTRTDDDTEIRSWPLDDEGMPVVAGDDADVLHLEIEQPEDTHNGGHLVFGPDGALWIGTGDGGGVGDPDGNAQDDGSLLGKILRVVPDPSGGVRTISSNPGWERNEIWAIGLRNPWRWSFDRDTNRLWVADVGQWVMEEVSVVDPDVRRPDFGWNLVEGTLPFEGEPSADQIEPMITYGRDDGCSVTGGYVYRGDRIPGLHGWYLFSDFCRGWIRAVPSDDPRTEPVELVSESGNVTSFGELEDGELVLLTVDGIHTLLPSPDRRGAP